MITDDITPDAYRHWVLAIEPPVARLALADGADGTDASLESRLEVYVELSDAVQRLRFEHPDVGTMVVSDLPDVPAGLAPEVARHVSTYRAEVCRAIEDACADAGGRGPASEAVVLGPLWREDFDTGFAYPNVRVEIDEAAGVAAVTVVGPLNRECFAPEPGPRRLRSHWWPLAVCREFDDALLVLRGRSPQIGTVELRTEGDVLAVASADVALTCGSECDWFVREVVSSWKRTLQRLDHSWQSVVAVVEADSCFVGTLLELVLAADKTSMPAGRLPDLFLTGMNFGPLPQDDGSTRLAARLAGRRERLDALAARVGDPLSAADAAELGLLSR